MGDMMHQVAAVARQFDKFDKQNYPWQYVPFPT
jgi:hypothetical protein